MDMIFKELLNQLINGNHKILGVSTVATPMECAFKFCNPFPVNELAKVAGLYHRLLK